MTFKFDISAGEFFELIRPTVLVLSGFVSIWVLVSARRHRFRNYVAIAWALGTLFFPLVTLPLYLIARLIRRRSGQPPDGAEVRSSLFSSPASRWPVVIPLVYATVVLSLIGSYLYRDYHSVDSHLARAAHAKLHGNRGGTIDEYRAALTLEDDPHTRKLLAIELADLVTGLGRCLNFEGGTRRETDDVLAFRVATCLIHSSPNQATSNTKVPRKQGLHSPLPE